MWNYRVSMLNKILQNASFTLDDKQCDADSAFSWWEKKSAEIRDRGRTVFLVGNGASASMASHFAADLCKNACIHTEVFTDLAQLTAIANDIGYDQVFSVPLRFHMHAEDMLVAISSSGRSPNILNAVQAAKEAGGTVVTLSAMDSANPLRLSGNLNCYVEAMDYGMSETAHAAILHHWMDSLSS